MYKVTIEEVLGEIKKTTIIETDDVELVRELLDLKDVKEVDSENQIEIFQKNGRKFVKNKLKK